MLSLVGMNDFTCSFNPSKYYFVMLRRFEGLCAIIGKDCAHVVLGRDDCLHMFLQPSNVYFVVLRRFEGSCMIIGKDHTCAILGRDEESRTLLQPFEGLFHCTS